MLRMQVYIPEEIFINLKSRAVVEEVSMSELIRRGLRKVLEIDERKTDPMKEFVGKCRLKKKTNAKKEINNYYKQF